MKTLISILALVILSACASTRHHDCGGCKDKAQCEDKEHGESCKGGCKH